MRAAIFPGTFDPPTLGHLNVIERASLHFDRFVVAAGNNPEKDSFFSLEERALFLKKITSRLPNVEVISFEKLLVDFAAAQNIKVVVRAIRSLLDYEYESQQANMSRSLAGLETFFLSVDEKYRLISSTLVKEVVSFGKRAHGFVPPEIEEMVFKRLNRST